VGSKGRRPLKAFFYIFFEVNALIFRSRRAIGKVPKSKTGSTYDYKQVRAVRRVRFFSTLVGMLFLVGIVGGLILTFYVLSVAKSLPSVDLISSYVPSETTKIYSDKKIVLAELHQEENRILMPLEEISPFIKEAVIATEDTDFYRHHGINFKGIARAMFKNVLAMSFVEGASTLTQQLARNLFLHKQKKLSRKVAEAILAIQIERSYTKTDILEMYLNQVYWGHNAYGIESAAQLYFGKRAKDLNLAESAMLIGLLKGPELFSPFRNYTFAKQRQKTVLNRMAKINFISQSQADAAYTQDLKLAPRRDFRYRAPYFTSYIVSQLNSRFGEDAVLTSGMRVYTTLDYELQVHAERLVREYVDKGRGMRHGETNQPLNFEQAAILAIEPSTGYIKVMQGGTDFRQNEFNRCVQAKRQPGSTFKPFVYLAALEKGFSPNSIVLDAPVTFATAQGPYSPINYTKTFLGEITLKKALEQSVNVVAIKINRTIGPENVIRVARQLGINSPMYPFISLPLGAHEVTMLELVSAYGVLANSGRRVDVTGITRIEDRDGNVIYKHALNERRVADPEVVAQLVDMMTGVVRDGTGKNAYLPRPIAGKTGTTSDYKDAWFIGFVPQLVTGTWLGNDNNTPMNRMTGGWMPAMMWRDFMKEALKSVPVLDFPKSTRSGPKRMAEEEETIPVEHAPPIHSGESEDPAAQKQVLNFFE
jgi:penicillin-binding protein 1A